MNRKRKKQEKRDRAKNLLNPPPEDYTVHIAPFNNSRLTIRLSCPGKKPESFERWLSYIWDSDIFLNNIPIIKTIILSFAVVIAALIILFVKIF